MYVCMHVWVYVCMYVCMYIYVYAGMYVYICAYMCVMYMPKDFHIIFSVSYIIIIYFSILFFSVSYIVCSKCVYLCTETLSLTYFVYKLNCFPSLCHTLGVTVYDCVLCLIYVLLNEWLHMFFK